ncbi:hypothetical protein SAY87_015064 [Trapa incisa]|uniref:BHLH domain-containing protein n=1 Tax=Trapa incisa TaxID=236973 RepID=A0AAN7JM20_9MYRT|nr:hypothetical protein SAY87_015064 [Trapa incisa]
MKRANREPAIKRLAEMVRKEKLGDGITALHELVSPFGKTGTTSVLHEAIEYIKCLHDQVNHFTGKSVKAIEGQPERNFRSRGLCLVPMSSTFTIASETPSYFFACLESKE